MSNRNPWPIDDPSWAEHEYRNRPATIHPRLDGPPRHLDIRPAIPWRQLAIMLLGAALIGFWLAVGHS